GGDLNTPRRGDAGDGFLEVHIGVVNLDALIATVGDIHETRLLIDGDAVYRTKLILAVAVRSHRLNPSAVLRYFDEARVAIAIAHIHIVLRIKCDVGLPVECAHGSDRKALRDLLSAFNEALEVVDRLGLSAERHSDVAVRIEFDDHGGT